MADEMAANINRNIFVVGNSFSNPEDQVDHIGVRASAVELPILPQNMPQRIHPDEVLDPESTTLDETDHQIITDVLGNQYNSRE